MGYRLRDDTTIALVFDAEVLPGGPEAWGDGELVVRVRGAQNLGSFFALSERIAELQANAAGDTLSPADVEAMREIYRVFADDVLVSWSIEGVEPSLEGLMSLPRPLAFAMLGAWQRLGDGGVGPPSGGASENGSTSAAPPATTAAG